MTQVQDDSVDLNDPGFLVTRLCELAPKLSEAQRQQIADRLRTAAVISPCSCEAFEQAAAQIRTKFQISPDQALDADRLIDLLDVLLDFALNLDQFVWGTWRGIGPESTVKRPAPLLRMVKAFVTGDANVPRPILEKDVRLLRALTAAVVSAAGEIGRSFANDHSDRFSPLQIEDAVRAEGVPMVPIISNVSVKCWQKYVRLAATMEAASVEKDINMKIVEIVQRLIGGARAPGGPRP